LYRFIRAYSLTLQLAIVNEDPWMHYLQSGGRVLLCTWHQQFFSAIRHFQAYRAFHPALMISKSADGEMIAGVASRTGWSPVRGSSSKEGRAALYTMIEKLKTSRLAAHIVDGPRGPAGIVKPGIIRLAHGAEAVIVPFYIEADHAWYFNSWDRFMLPKPFSKVRLIFDDMLRYPPSSDETVFEEQRRELEARMQDHLHP
jgi:hypothetical protein